VVGFASFDLMVAHILTIVAGYASGRWVDVPGTTWDLVTAYGGVLLAVAGTACLVMVVVTSVKAARRQLRYESWHLIHLYGYLGVGLALPHQLWTGQEFLRSPGATVYWWTLWAAAAAAVLVWRVWLPVWRSLRHGLRVSSVVRESSDGLGIPDRAVDRLPVKAGQFQRPVPLSPADPGQPVSLWPRRLASLRSPRRRQISAVWRSAAGHLECSRARGRLKGWPDAQRVVRLELPASRRCERWQRDSITCRRGSFFGDTVASLSSASQTLAKERHGVVPLPDPGKNPGPARRACPS
jgi:hypothetical protein